VTYSVLIADDHPVVLGGLKALIAENPQFRVVATAADGASALAELQRTTPDVAVLDLNMPIHNGLAVLQRAAELHLSTPIVILAAAASDADIHALVTSGAAGLLFKDAAPQVLTTCLERVLAGRKWIAADALAAVQRQEVKNQLSQSRLSSLTQREIELLRLVQNSRSNKEIAYALNLSEGTVKVHLNNMFRKLGVSSRAELASLKLVESGLS
jgi:two-component system nitrate/nitrite response regulator NarL